MSSDWLDDTACTPEQAPLFDDPGNATIAEYVDRYQQAKAICDGCPVRGECLADGITHHGTGIFAGVLLVDGEVTEFRPRGPRKKEAAV